MLGHLLPAQLFCGVVVVVAAGSGQAALDASNFADAVAAKPTPWLIEFYSNMCSSCREFAPTWDALVDKLQGVESLNVGRVNIDESAGLKLAKQLKNVLTRIPKVVYVPKPAASLDYSVVDGTTVDELLGNLAKLTTLPSEL